MIALLLATVAAAASAAAPKNTVMSSDITVRAKSAGPSLSVPPPGASKPVVDEVLNSLTLGKGGTGEPSPDNVRVSADRAGRLARPYPDAPFLALSPENIQALYDSWTFEVRSDDGEIVWKTEGVGLLREKVDWDGAGPDGRLAVVAGRRYFYRFTGRRGARAFAVACDPVEIKSFTRREFAGETRMEVSIDEVFASDKATWATGAERWLDPLAGAMRAAGSARLELAQKSPRSNLAKARAKALKKRFAEELRADEADVTVDMRTGERGEYVAVILPPSKGAALRNE